MEYLFNEHFLSNDTPEAKYIVDESLKYISFKTKDKYRLYYVEFDSIGEFIKDSSISNDLDIFVIGRESPVVKISSELQTDGSCNRIVTVSTYHGNPTEVKPNNTRERSVLDKINNDCNLF